MLGRLPRHPRQYGRTASTRTRDRAQLLDPIVVDQFDWHLANNGGKRLVGHLDRDRGRVADHWLGWIHPQAANSLRVGGSHSRRHLVGEYARLSCDDRRVSDVLLDPKRPLAFLRGWQTRGYALHPPDYIGVLGCVVVHDPLRPVWSDCYDAVRSQNAC